MSGTQQEINIMRRSIIVLVCFFVFMATLVPAASAQDRRRTRFGRKARTAAIIGGGTGAGALIGGKKGALVGAGAGTLYAVNRRSARRN
jgi:preprotein translocase subunit SecG